ncbi:MAG: helicase [Planctomycetes bacterium]|nr:helicase [Planctomycetota bacterium]
MPAPVGSSVQIRDTLVDALRLDLVGPAPGSHHAREVLPQPPSRWYLTGFLVPYAAAEAEKQDPAADEGMELAESGESGDDNDAPEPAAARRAFFPSSIGVSLLVPDAAKQIEVEVHWGDYKRDAEPPGESAGERGGASAQERWRRTPRTERVRVSVGRPTPQPVKQDIPNSDGLRLFTSIRTVTPRSGLSAGTRAVSIFLVNSRQPSDPERKDEGFIFQAELRLRCDQPIVPRPNLRGLSGDDWDDRVADLQYRDAFEYAVGHGVSTTVRADEEARCTEVATIWIPSAEVEKVLPAVASGVELKMDLLACSPSAADLRAKLQPLVTAYQAWIQRQTARPPSDARRAEVVRQLGIRMTLAAGRIADGLQSLDDPDALDAFRIANRTMAAAGRQRQLQQGAPLTDPAWYPFQLAFLLMNLRSMAEPAHRDRGIVDLLFFPTGGGKTEAYLGLAAFTLVLRRLRNPGLASAGVSVLMRYTLRLLTLDQLARAATLICALELERERDPKRLGPWPFEIGLWVGQSATPNKMGRKGDGDSRSARARTIRFKNDDRKPSPIPLENCPWCGTKFKRDSFSLRPNDDNPIDLRIVCVNRQCPFIRDRVLPIVAVDEPLYRRVPCFVIATVDKFASLPWVGRTGMLFGKADRADPKGFYGPCDPAVGTKLERALLPPDLIIQDELHLISGPLGTMVGLYETAIDALAARGDGERTIRPKIIASTATVRCAQKQIQALFARAEVEVFPPPGPDRRDSFFARTAPRTERNARRYVGIAAQGRSLKVVLLRTYLALLGAAEKAYVAAGGARNRTNAVDPYMTLLGYFNSLRELGGSRCIVQDEVRARLGGYSTRLRDGETNGPFADRDIAYEVVELTSRVSTDKVAEAKRRLALAFAEKERVDVALATNMISVGLDIIRLGLMVVLGQPKMTAEYIQATSRVGRDDARPGLVVALLNSHRPRDRSHYERFEAYHQSFYRAVEATSVTPFAPRAIDRAVAAVAVALSRLGLAQMTPSPKALAVAVQRPNLAFVATTLADRAARHANLTRQEEQDLKQTLNTRVADLLDAWSTIASEREQVGAGLKYQEYEEGQGQHLLFDPLDPDLERQPGVRRKFKAHRSLRDVEPSVNLWVRTLDGVDLEGEDVEE